MSNVVPFERPQKPALCATLAMSLFVVVAFFAFLYGFITQKNPIMAFANFERQEREASRPKEAA